MNEQELFEAYGAPRQTVDLAELSRRAHRELWAAGGHAALEPCIRRCGTLVLPPRAYCRPCWRERRKA